MLRWGVLSALLLVTVVIASEGEQLTKLTYYYTHTIPKQTSMLIQFKLHCKEQLYSTAIQKLEQMKAGVQAFLASFRKGSAVFDGWGELQIDPQYKKEGNIITWSESQGTVVLSKADLVGQLSDQLNERNGVEVEAIEWAIEEEGVEKYVIRLGLIQAEKKCQYLGMTLAHVENIQQEAEVVTQFVQQQDSDLIEELEQDQEQLTYKFSFRCGGKNKRSSVQSKKNRSGSPKKKSKK